MFHVCGMREKHWTPDSDLVGLFRSDQSDILHSACKTRSSTLHHNTQQTTMKNTGDK